MDLKDLMPQPGDINKVTEHINQPPTGAQVTEIKSPTTLNQAEAEQQAQVQAAVNAAPEEAVDPDYKYEIEQGAHKVTVVREHGLTYNYRATCSCAWTGRYLTQSQAEAGAKGHIQRRK